MNGHRFLSDIVNRDVSYINVIGAVNIEALIVICDCEPFKIQIMHSDNFNSAGIHSGSLQGYRLALICGNDSRRCGSPTRPIYIRTFIVCAAPDVECFAASKDADSFADCSKWSGE
jgi:hypothetical protein